MKNTKKKNSMWKGIVIEESLSDQTVLWETQLLKVSLAEKNTHQQTVICDKKTIEKIQAKLKPKYYAYFWKDNSVIVAFKKKSFEFDSNDSEKREQAIAFGEKQGIPKEQLKFTTE